MMLMADPCPPVSDAFPALGFNPCALIYLVPHRGFLGLQEIISGGQLPPLVNDQKQTTRFVS